MSQLKTVKLYGALTQFSDEPLQFVAYDMVDVFNALRSQCPGIRSFLSENPNYSIVLLDEHKENPRAVEGEFFGTPFVDDVAEIHIFPRMEGEEPVTAAWAAFAVAYPVAAAIVVNIIISIAIGAIVSMLSPKTKKDDKEKKEKPSFLFNGPENVTEQGYMVPIVYGTHMTGSVVVSAGIVVQNNSDVPVEDTVSPPPLPYQWPNNNNEFQGG